MDSEGNKLVNFAEYCDKCKHYDLDGTEEPCNECLAYPVNQYTHKPVNFESKE